MIFSTDPEPRVLRRDDVALEVRILKIPENDDHIGTLFCGIGHLACCISKVREKMKVELRKFCRSIKK